MLPQKFTEAGPLLAVAHKTQTPTEACTGQCALETSYTAERVHDTMLLWLHRVTSSPVQRFRTLYAVQSCRRVSLTKGEMLVLQELPQYVKSSERIQILVLSLHLPVQLLSKVWV